MRSQDNAASKTPMSADAYAGFLKLLLTPAHRVPEMSDDVMAYLAYANRRDPLPSDVFSGPRSPSRRAA